jgi:hypothetical protein
MGEKGAEQNTNSGGVTEAVASGEGAGWMGSTKAWGLRVESSRKTEKDAEQGVISGTAAGTTAYSGKGAGWIGLTKAESLRVELVKVTKKGAERASSGGATGAAAGRESKKRNKSDAGASEESMKQ